MKRSKLTWDVRVQLDNGIVMNHVFSRKKKALDWFDLQKKDGRRWLVVEIEERMIHDSGPEGR